MLDREREQGQLRAEHMQSGDSKGEKEIRRVQSVDYEKHEGG